MHRKQLSRPRTPGRGRRGHCPGGMSRDPVQPCWLMLSPVPASCPPLRLWRQGATFLLLDHPQLLAKAQATRCTLNL